MCPACSRSSFDQAACTSLPGFTMNHADSSAICYDVMMTTCMPALLVRLCNAWNMHFASISVVCAHLMVPWAKDVSTEACWEVQVVVMAHSWGDNVFRNFLHWMEQEDKGWADKHIHAYANIGGPVLGVPKSIGSLLSGIPRGPVLQDFGPCSCPRGVMLTISASCLFVSYCQCSRRLFEGRDNEANDNDFDVPNRNTPPPLPSLPNLLETTLLGGVQMPSKLGCDALMFLTHLYLHEKAPLGKGQ